jgi:hypothetical protein
MNENRKRNQKPNPEKSKNQNQTKNINAMKSNNVMKPNQQPKRNFNYDKPAQNVANQRQPINRYQNSPYNHYQPLHQRNHPQPVYNRNYNNNPKDAAPANKNATARQIEANDSPEEPTEETNDEPECPDEPSQEEDENENNDQAEDSDETTTGETVFFDDGSEYGQVNNVSLGKSYINTVATISNVQPVNSSDAIVILAKHFTNYEEIPAILDSGASHTMSSTKILSKFIKEIKPSKLTAAITAGGTEYPVVGYCELTVKLCPQNSEDIKLENIKVHLVESNDWKEVLLGKDIYTN